QTLVLYRPDPDGDEVLGSATIAGTSRRRSTARGACPE
ncbi:hypothetical protein, partial [Mycobacterium malmoense]